MLCAKYEAMSVTQIGAYNIRLYFGMGIFSTIEPACLVPMLLCRLSVMLIKRGLIA
jgi:hypothetical protein